MRKSPSACAKLALPTELINTDEGLTLSQETWIRSRSALWIFAILLPPLGLALLWIRPSRIWWKLLGTLAIAAVTFFHLSTFFGLRAELDGTGIRPVFYFDDAEERYAEIERQRQANTAGTADTASAANMASAAGAVWPSFRGPDGEGRVLEPIRTDWPAEGLPRLWKQPAGGGYSGFAIAGGRAFTLEQRRDEEAVVAYDLETGAELWIHAWPGHFQEAMGGDGPRAAPTWDATGVNGGRLYAIGALGELRVVDADGELVWHRNVLEERGEENLYYGVSAAPLVVDDMVVVVSGRSLVAYDKETGDPRWTSEDALQAYVSPRVVTVAGERQILTVTAHHLMGLTLADGKVLWRHPWETQYDINAAQPLIVGENRVFVSSGYGHGASLVEVRRTGDELTAETLWENNRMKNRFASSVLLDGHVYGLDEGILACIVVETGERCWKGGRYGHGQLLLADDHLVVLSEKGQVALVEATPERHVEVASFNAIDGKTWNHPAIADGVLLVRNAREMAAFQISP